MSLIDDASIEAIARRVAELLAELLAKTEGRRLVTAGELAERLGVERSWVYANARRLGGVRLSDGLRAVEMAREGVPLNIIQRQLGHANLGITSIYLQGIASGEIVAAVHGRPAPVMSASAGLRLV